MTFIEYYYYKRGRGWDDDLGKLFLSNGVEQKKIIAWCKKNPREDLAEKLNDRHLNPENVAPCEWWEASLIEVISVYGNTGELSEWRLASTEQRKAHTAKVARLARKLAEALTEQPRPYYPPVLGLFEDKYAQEIVDLLPDPGHHAYEIYHKSPRRIPQRLLSHYYFRETQQLPSLLNRLANHAEEQVSFHKPIPRPNTGHVNSRAFALHMAEEFKRIFKRTPNEIIAACVCLKYPELENPPNSDTIRDWRGVK